MTETETKESTRVEAFSDGVFAIAITLLVLDLIETLHVPSKGGLLQSFLDHWESFLAYFIGFTTLLVCWINHHFAFGPVKKVDYNLMWINGFLLFVVTLTPFSTAVLAEYLEKERNTALAIYGANYVLISIAAYAICRYAYKRRMVREENLERYHSHTLIYRFSIYYTLGAFFLCFVSVVIPLILYVILFTLFAAPGKFAERVSRFSIRKNRKPAGKH